MKSVKPLSQNKSFKLESHKTIYIFFVYLSSYIYQGGFRMEFTTSVPKTEL